MARNGFGGQHLGGLHAGGGHRAGPQGINSIGLQRWAGAKTALTVDGTLAQRLRYKRRRENWRGPQGQAGLPLEGTDQHPRACRTACRSDPSRPGPRAPLRAPASRRVCADALVRVPLCTPQAPGAVSLVIIFTDDEMEAGKVRQLSRDVQLAGAGPGLAPGGPAEPTEPSCGLWEHVSGEPALRKELFSPACTRGPG